MFNRGIALMLCLAAIGLSGPAGCISGGAMNDAKLKEALAPGTDGWEGRPGAWAFSYRELEMMLLTDENHDRMRIISPVAAEGELLPEEMQIILRANFDRTLDARYATWQGKLWAAFIHPLGSLTEEEARAGLEQVWGLVRNYGGSYASGNLGFAPGQGGDSETLR